MAEPAESSATGNLVLILLLFVGTALTLVLPAVRGLLRR